MPDSLILQIFLLLNVFFMGALATVAFRHARAHFTPSQPTEAPRRKVQQVHLPPAVKERLLHAAQANFQSVLDHSADELQRDLKTTASGLSKQLEQLGHEIITDEMKRYRAGLDELRDQAQIAIGGAQSSIATHRAELEAKFIERHAQLEKNLADEMAAEKQRLIEQMDTKLSDAVASFLIETLQHNVDLGAQSTYLMTMLDEHKAELTKKVTDEA